MTIFLCGFMGCGKTTVGEILAKQLGLPLIDTDAYIVEQEGRSIPEIFAQEGEPYFRKVEAQAIRTLCTKNAVIACGGGEVIVQNGEVLGCVPLPLAGLMNPKPAEEMNALVENLGKAWKQIGCDIQSPFMTMALIPLACLPELRLTNRGLVDCTTFSFTDLEVEPEQ